MTREQIYKAALYDVLGVHSMECEGAKCFPRVMVRLQEALEAAAKVGGLADDEDLRDYCVDAVEMNLKPETQEERFMCGMACALTLRAIDAYLRGAR